MDPATTTTTSLDTNDEEQPPNRCLGKLAAKVNRKQLLFATFMNVPKTDPVPNVSDFWAKRAKFPSKSYGNRQHGCCTRASQAVLATRMERIEQRRTLDIAEEEVLRVYYEMTERLYGGGDTGAYETDALDDWRRADRTFKDVKGRPLTIDAYVRVNHIDQIEIRRAIHLAGAHGVKLCFALPLAWSSTELTEPWDAPADGRFIGNYEPYSWGGHSMTADAYNKQGVRVLHTWFDGDKTVQSHQFVTWAGMAYCDEMYVVIDSVNAWRKRAEDQGFDMTNLVDAVNSVSSVSIPEK